MKILILKPSSLGDVIHALPVLRLLKAHLPQSEIYWWLDGNLAPLLAGDRDLTGIFSFQRKRWAAFHHWPEIVGSVRSMRQRKFDWAIDLQGLARSAAFAWLANAQLTVGLDNPREGMRDGARAVYDLTPPTARPDTHAVDRYLAVLPLLDVPVNFNFEWLPHRPEVAAEVQRKWQPEGARWVALLPGARWDNKRWPAAYFRRLVTRLDESTGVRFVVLGARDEFELGEEIVSADPNRCLNLAGSTSLWEMIEWIRLSQFVVTNDTGPMHVAAAMRKPLVAIFGPTNYRNTGPYGQLGNVLQTKSLPCVPCMKDYCAYREPLACLHAISPEIVSDRIKKNL